MDSRISSVGGTPRSTWLRGDPYVAGGRGWMPLRYLPPPASRAPVRLGFPFPPAHGGDPAAPANAALGVPPFRAMPRGSVCLEDAPQNPPGRVEARSEWAAPASR